MIINASKPPHATHRPGFRTTTCRDCGISFQDLSGHQLCDGCLADHINGAGILELDDDDGIFARPPRFARRRRTPTPPTGMVGRIACAVCGLTRDALICKECAETPEASRRRVLDWLRANVTRANALLAEWDAVRAPQQAAWDKVQGARTLPDYAARCVAHKAAGNVYGKLLEAHERYELALQPLAIERERLEKALSILDTL